MKCSGGKLFSQRVQFVRSTYDWVVCSEPLARLRRTRAYGYSIVSWRSLLGGRFELESNLMGEVPTRNKNFRGMQVCAAEKESLQNGKTHACGGMPGSHAVRIGLGQWLRGIKDRCLATFGNSDLFSRERFNDAHRSMALRTFWNSGLQGEHRRCYRWLIQENAAERQ